MEEETKKSRRQLFNMEPSKGILLLLIMIGFAIGILMTAQYRTKPTRSSTPLLSYAVLRDSRDSLKQKQDNYKKEIEQTNQAIESFQVTNKSNKTTNKGRLQTWQQLREEVGVAPSTGEGVIITMNDSSQDNPQVDSITHAADLRDIVNFLWARDATSISINGERIVLNTSIDCIVNTILINNVKTTAPFVISAIGDSGKLKQDLDNTSNLSELHDRVKSEGLVFNIEKSRNVKTAGFNGSTKIQFAKTVTQ